MRPGITGQSLKAVRKSSLKLQLKRVIIRARLIANDLHADKRRIRTHQPAQTDQFSAQRRYVRGADSLSSTKRSLNRQVPLIGARQLQIRIEGGDKCKRWIRKRRWLRRGQRQWIGDVRGRRRKKSG